MVGCDWREGSAVVDASKRPPRRGGGTSSEVVMEDWQGNGQLGTPWQGLDVERRQRRVLVQPLLFLALPAPSHHISSLQIGNCCRATGNNARIQAIHVVCTGGRKLELGYLLFIPRRQPQQDMVCISTQSSGALSQLPSLCLLCSNASSSISSHRLLPHSASISCPSLPTSTICPSFNAFFKWATLWKRVSAIVIHSIRNGWVDCHSRRLCHSGAGMSADGRESILE